MIPSKLLLLIRNLIEANGFVSSIYNAVGSSTLYKNFINKKIKNNIENFNHKKDLRFLLELSSICNAKCIFCPYQKLTRPKQIMPDEIFQKIIERIKEEEINPLEFSLYHTGEPFLDKKIFNRIDILKHEFPNSKIDVTSNFSTADDEIINNILNSKIDTLNISLNSINPTSYKNIMGLDYDRTISNIEKLLTLKNKQKSNLYVLLSAVICEENKNEIKDFWLKWNKKVNGIRFQRPAEWFGDITNERPLSKKCLYPCNEIFSRPAILSNGEFSFCCQDAEGRVHKNIMETPILEAFHSEEFAKLRELHLNHDISQIESCRRCFAVNSNGANWLFNH